MDLFKTLCKAGTISIVLLMIMGCLVIVPNDVSAASTDWGLEDDDTIERIGFTSCELPDGRMFVTGGCNLTATTITNETWIFDPRSSDWEKVADCPLVLESSAAVAMPDGKVYMFGGMVSMMPITYSLVYDVATDTWSSGVALPQTVIMADAVAISDEVIMIMGGLTSDSIFDTTVKCYFYDTVSSTFDPAPNMPNGRFLGEAVLSGSYVYYFGGSEAGGAGTSTIYGYNILGGYWTTMGSLPTVLTGMAVTAGSDGLMYIIGGSETFAWYGFGSDLAYVYNTGYSTVTKLPTLDGPISHAISFETDDGRIFYMLGNNGSYGNSDVYSLKVWNAEASLSSSTVKQGGSVWLHISISSKMVQMAGMGGTAYLCRGDLTYAAYFIDSDGRNDVMMEISVSDGLPAGDYQLVLSGVNIGSYGQDFRFKEMSLTVTEAPSAQDQLDDLASELNSTQDQLDNMTEQNDELSDQLDDLASELNSTQDQLDAAQEELNDAISSKQDAMFGYIILVLVLVSLVIGVIILVRKK